MGRSQELRRRSDSGLWGPSGNGFFWFAGQGGFGIQTAPAAARLAAALLLGTTPDPLVAAIDPRPYDPARFGGLE
jgi:D-arginine dehydrogenase